MWNTADPIVRIVQVLAVFVVLSVAATPPYGGCTKGKAYIAAMKSDLRSAKHTA